MDEEGGLVRRLLAVILAGLAAKGAMMLVEQFWTRGLGQDLPGEDDENSIVRSVIWIGLTAAAVAMARELARGLTVPRSSG